MYKNKEQTLRKQAWELIRTDKSFKESTIFFSDSGEKIQIQFKSGSRSPKDCYIQLPDGSRTPLFDQNKEYMEHFYPFNQE